MSRSSRGRWVVSLIVIVVLGLAVIGSMGYGAFIIGRISRAASTTTPSRPTATPTPAPVVTILGIKNQAKLATTEYTLVAEVYNETVPDDWRAQFGVKESILLLAYGNVTAGFDLEKLDEDDLWVDRDRVQLHLPAPEVFAIDIDFDKTHVVYYDKSLLVSHDPALEGETLRQAEAALQEAALEANILKSASGYGQVFFERFLYSLGFTEVEVIVD
ncbi:MAG: DUF4230 domain-containing protein [Anaerolineae bacterium]